MAANYAKVDRAEYLRLVNEDQSVITQRKRIKECRKQIGRRKIYIYNKLLRREQQKQIPALLKRIRERERLNRAERRKIESINAPVRPGMNSSSSSNKQPYDTGKEQTNRSLQGEVQNSIGHQNPLNQNNEQKGSAEHSQTG